jgi:hypothetical protein
MSHPRASAEFTSFVTAQIVIAVLCASLQCFAQTSRTSESNGRETPESHRVQHASVPADFEQFAVYWTEEPGWHTDLQLRNNLAAKELVVTPALRSADGTEANLAPVTIQPGDVATVSLHQAMAKAAPQFNATYGSVVLRYRAPVSKALNAVAMIHLEGHPIGFHVDAYLQPKEWTSGSREGIWWLPRETATDYLILTNTADKALDTNLILRDSSGNSSQEKLPLSARQTARLSVRSLLKNSHLGGSYGGITIEVAKGVAYLDTFHVIFDEVAGSSAVMRMFDNDPKATIGERAWGGLKDWTIRAPMMALTHPDPVLGFPADTQLQPVIFLRNASAQPYVARMHFNWRSESGSGKTRPISFSLKPYETHLIDVASLQGQNVLPAEAQWASVFVGIPGAQPDKLLAVAASYDKTGRYGSQTPFNDQLAFHWEGDQWQVDETHNSIITAGNGGMKPVKARLTLLYNNGKDIYEIERLLAPEEQMWIDVSQLVGTQLPDKNGHTLPSGDASGAYRLEEPGNAGVGNLFEGKLILDKTYGESVYGCMICCAPAVGFMDFNPLGVAVSGNALQSVSGTDACTGEQVDMTGDYTTWGTGNTAIATATMNSIHGVAAGSTNNYAQGLISWGDGDDRRVCRTRQDHPSGGTNVQVPTYFGPTGYDPTDCGCGSNSAGTCITVHDQVLDQNGSLMKVSGITPQENVCDSAHGCQTGYHVFSTPQTTLSDGKFDDDPVGSCFPNPTGNQCITVSVIYKASLNALTYSVPTFSQRKDCVQGERDDISLNPTAYNKTFTTGTVPP